MSNIALEAKTKEHKLLKAYLEANASECLIEKINNGVKIAFINVFAFINLIMQMSKDWKDANIIIQKKERMLKSRKAARSD